MTWHMARNLMIHVLLDMHQWTNNAHNVNPNLDSCLLNRVVSFGHDIIHAVVDPLPHETMSLLSRANPVDSGMSSPVKPCFLGAKPNLNLSREGGHTVDDTGNHGNPWFFIGK